MDNKVLFIDICDTLFASNTTLDFVEWRFPAFSSYRKRLHVRAITYILKLLFKVDYVKLESVKLLRNLPKAQLSEDALMFYNEILQQKQINGSHLIIDDLRRQGFKLVIVSATLDFIAEVVAQKLNIPIFYASKLKYVNSKCAGKVETDLLFSKKDAVDHFLSTIGDSYVSILTDNKTDLEIANSANQAYVVSLKSDIAFWRRRMTAPFVIIER